ncbi:hypothetical protein WN48_01213 [Eufriesea mexicana]|nr:hypothetical protein WN48_01213 [Eufriesea mexicana]
MEAYVGRWSTRTCRMARCRCVLRYASANESSLPAEGKIGVIPLSGYNGAKSDFRNDRVKRAQGFTEGGCPSQ